MPRQTGVCSLGYRQPAASLMSVPRSLVAWLDCSMIAQLPPAAAHAVTAVATACAILRVQLHLTISILCILGAQLAFLQGWSWW